MKEYLEKMKLYRYIVDEFIVTGTPKPITIPMKNITSISIVKKFIDHMFPIIQVEVVLDLDQYYQILSNIMNIKVNMKFMCFDCERDSPIEGIKNIIKTQVFSHTFKVISNDITPYVETKINTIEDEKKAPDKETKVFKFNLFSHSHTERYRTIINDILHNHSIHDALCFCMTNAGIDKVLYQIPDNGKVKSQFLLPPLNFLGMVNYIHHYEGIYNNSILLFQDIDVLYFGDRSPVCKTFRTQEIKNVYITINDLGENENKYTGAFIDKPNDKIMLNVSSDFSIVNDSIQVKEMYGKQIMSINGRDSAVISLTSPLKYSGKGTKISRNFNNNTFLLNSRALELGFSNSILRIPLADVHYGVLTPNKAYVVNFTNPLKNKEHGGYYKLHSLVYSFTKENEYFILNTLMELKKS